MRGAEQPRGLVVHRIIGCVGLGVAGIFVTDLGPHRFAAAALLLLVILPIIVYQDLTIPSLEVDRYQLVTDMFFVVMIAALLPSGWIGALIVAAVLLVGKAATNVRPLHITIAAVVTLALMALIAVTREVDDWVLPWTTVLVTIGPAGTMAQHFQRVFHEAVDRAHLLIDSADALFFEIDPANGTVLSLYGRVKEIAGSDRSSLVGLTLNELVHPDDRHLVTLLTGWTGDVEVSMRFLDLNGRARWLRVFGQPGMRDGRRTLIGIAVDITGLEETQRRLKYSAERDGLTGLMNRTSLDKRLQLAIETNPSRVAFAVIDLDDFKRVNDTLGHPVGDEVLMYAGHRLYDLNSSEVTVGRLGGDEFGIIVQSDNPETTVFRVAHDARIVLGQPVMHGELELHVNASVGIAICPPNGDAATLLRNADIAMYQAKRSHTGVAKFTAAPDDLTVNELSTATRLKRALESEMQMWFQPVVDVRSGTIVSFEGLARWHHDDRIVLPAKFLPVVERSGLSERFDMWALDQAVHFAARVCKVGVPHKVAVNMTTAGLSSLRLIPHLRSLLENSDVSPAQITIEISERDFDFELAPLHSTLYELREIGIGLSLDDYGTGHSSLIRLRDVPFTELKIDRSFVSKITTDGTDAVIVKSTIDLATELGLITVAEGIEDEATQRKLVEMRCSHGQGFHFARPQPVESILRSLRRDGGTTIDITDSQAISVPPSARLRWPTNH